MTFEVRSDAADHEALRVARRRRVFDLLRDHAFDALVMGRPAEVTYATGTRQLWTAGSRPFGPAAIAVAATGRIHLLATSDDGVPPEVPSDDLFGLSWNPANLQRALAAVPGLAEARHIATTSSTPGFVAFLRSIAPDADVVDGAGALAARRATKLPGEIECLSSATTLASAAVEAMATALTPGVSERTLLGVNLERLALLGAQTPPTEGVACATPTEGPVVLRRIATDDPITAGQLVVLDGCAESAGYEGGFGTTRVVGNDPLTDPQQALAARGDAQLHSIIACCRPGVTGPQLRAAATATGEPLPDEPFIVGQGMGVEPPVVTRELGDAVTLAPDMVLAVTSWVTEPGVGGWYERRLVVVGDAPRVLHGDDALEGRRDAP